MSTSSALLRNLVLRTNSKRTFSLMMMNSQQRYLASLPPDRWNMNTRFSSFSSSSSSNRWMEEDKLVAAKLRAPTPTSYYLSFLVEFWRSKLPRGFEDFFPEGSKSKPPEPSSTKESSKAEEEQYKSSEQKYEKKRQQRAPPPPPPPYNDDSANLPGLVAFLALMWALHSLLDEGERVRGQEITFVDFRNKLLIPGMVERLEIVNNKVARVILKPNATVETPQKDVDLWGTTTPANTTDGSDNIIGWEGNTIARDSKPGTQQPQYYFFIGSVESFEEKLTKAQSHMHPEEWIEVQYITRTNVLLEFIKLLPNLVLVFIFAYSIYKNVPGAAGGASAGGMGGIFQFGKSTAKKIKKEDVKVSFKDVAGCQQAKMEIMEFVDFLKDSERFTKLGAKIPKGALLCGPPGTGKTLLAKAVAGEAGVPFFSISGSDFIEMFVGVGPSRVRDLFKEARSNAPCIIFIDEIDAVGRKRGEGMFGGGNDERENTLNQLLVEMDGFTPTTGVVVLAGTNRVDILDQALTRPGRFDRQITVDRPDLQGRKEIFEVHLNGITLVGQKEDYAGRLAGLTPGFAGADIANICNEAAIVAARRKADAVSMDDFEKAIDRVIGGLESNKIMSAEERSIVAHHEAGHAIAGWFLEHADPLMKVTIIPRTSGALGFAQYLPKEVFLRSQEQIMDIVCMALAGRAAEQVFFGRVTTGASDDLRRVTQLVYSTIKEFGMNSKLGQLAFPKDNNGGYSDSTAEAMDDEARAIVDAAYQRTLDLITKHKDDVAKIANLLLEKETITHDDIVDNVGPRPFEGDAAYKEYVSSRHALKKDSQPKEEDNDKITLDEGLTPGLAFRSMA